MTDVVDSFMVIQQAAQSGGAYAMLTVVIPTAEVSRTGGKRRSHHLRLHWRFSQKSVSWKGIVVKNDFLRCATAREGDYILIGTSTDATLPDEAMK
jgi:hypothetical protein